MIPTTFTLWELNKLRELARQAHSAHGAADEDGQRMHNLTHKLDEYCGNANAVERWARRDARLSA